MTSDVAWIPWANDTWLSAGEIAFDPSKTNTMYLAMGIGVYQTVLPIKGQTSYAWTVEAAGIEQLISTWAISPPGGNLILTAWDRPIWTITDPDQYPSKYGPDNKAPIVHGWHADYASSDPSFIAATIANWKGATYSTDKGQTWQYFKGAPAKVSMGGSIAASTPQNMVWAMSNNGGAYYTQDGGATWKPVDIPGLSTTEPGWGWAYYFRRVIVAADRVIPNKFYLYNYNKGLYTSTDGGVTWQHTFVAKSMQENVSPWSGFHAKIRSVPGQANHLFFTAGPQGHEPHSLKGWTDIKFRRSVDGGATWSDIPNVAEVFQFGFGKAGPGRTYPSIYIVGWVSQEYGIWRSDDEGTSWVKLGDYPLGWLDSLTVVEGDMNTFGKVYVGFAGASFTYGVPNGTTAKTKTGSVAGAATSQFREEQLRKLSAQLDALREALESLQKKMQ